MEVFTYSETRQNMAALLEKADQGHAFVFAGKTDTFLSFGSQMKSVLLWIVRELILE